MSPATLATKFIRGGNPYKPVLTAHNATVDISFLTVDANAQGNSNNRIVGLAWHPSAGVGKPTSGSSSGTAAVHGSHTGQRDAHLAGDRGLLASASIDGTARLWHVPTGSGGGVGVVMDGLDASANGHR